MHKSYSQCGQDCFIDFILLRKKLIEREQDYKGFYVDIGCSQPVTGSNTYSFYERGWRGICVDANPDNEAPFRERRPDDTYVLAGVSDEEGILPFHMFQNPQANTFFTGRAEAANKGYLRTIDVPVRTLTSILDEHAPEGARIDFLSVDVEHYELQVLQGLDFVKYSPSIIVVEAIAPIARALILPVTRHMESRGYELIAHTGHDSFFALKG